MARLPLPSVLWGRKGLVNVILKYHTILIVIPYDSASKDIMLAAGVPLIKVCAEIQYNTIQYNTIPYNSRVTMVTINQSIFSKRQLMTSNIPCLLKQVHYTILYYTIII